MKVHGHCFCKAVVFEAEVSSSDVTVCHCVDCQILTGTAYRVSVPAPADSFFLKQGTPKIFLKVADSGKKRIQAFCESCGSPLYATDAVDVPKVYMLRVGTLDERAELFPQKEIWCRSALPWSQKLETPVRAEKQS